MPGDDANNSTAAGNGGSNERQLVLQPSPGGDPLHTSAHTAKQIFVFERQTRELSGFVHFSTSKGSECVRIKHLPSRKYLAIGRLKTHKGSEYYTAELIDDDAVIGVGDAAPRYTDTLFNLMSKSGEGSARNECAK